jgi:hypothetical protein
VSSGDSDVDQWALVAAGNSVTSRYLHVLVYEAAEPISPQRPNGRCGERGSAARGRALIKRSVRAVRVVVLDILLQHCCEVTLSDDQEMIEAFAA